MEQRTLVKWLKILVLFAAVCGLGLAGGVLPLAGQWLVESYPDFPIALAVAHLSVGFVDSLLLGSVLAWKIFGNIEKGSCIYYGKCGVYGTYLLSGGSGCCGALGGKCVVLADWYESSRNIAFVLCGHADRYWIFCSGSSIVSSHSESG